MIAILLCAGFGKRLRPLTEEAPKSLLDVADRPIIDYLVRQIADWPDLKAVHLLSNEPSASAFLEWWQGRWHRALKSRGVTFHLHGNQIHDDAEQRGAVGDLAYLADRIRLPERVLVAGGDSIYRFSLTWAHRRFQAQEDHLVLALREETQHEKASLSVPQFEEASSRLAGIRQGTEAAQTWSCPSLYFLRRSALRRLGTYLDEGGDTNTLGRFIDYLARHETVRALKVPDELEETRGTPLRFHINTPAQYKAACQILDQEPLMAT